MRARWTRSTSTAATPTARTGSAGALRVSTSTVESTTATMPTPRRAGARSSTGAAARSSSRRNAARSTTIVTTTATIAAGHMRERNAAPDACSPCSVIRFVKFEPGRKSEAAFDMNTVP